MNEIEELKAELQKFKDMAKKGLEEFKDVGGCWGCGLQLQLNQDMKDIKQLKAENERLNRCIVEALHHEGERVRENINYQLTLQKIKAISKEFIKNVSENCINTTPMYLVHKEILQLITKAEIK